MSKKENPRISFQMRGLFLWDEAYTQPWFLMKLEMTGSSVYLPL